jgi:hypothetical protein
MPQPVEINRGYVSGGLLPAGDRESWPRALRLLTRPEPLGGARQGRGTDAVRLALVPVLLIEAGLITLALELYLAVRRPNLGGIHGDALPHVDEFVRQYPLHPYPIVCKALELAYLRAELPRYATPDADVLEIAIGDGTLSEKVFPAGTAVIATDIAPYSLRHAAAKAHVTQALVCDALAPPFRPGSFDLLVANNFLHHVTGKKATVKAWTELADVVMFNENTPEWASGWCRPFILRRLGARKTSARVASAIERAHLQHLETRDQLESTVPDDCDLASTTSYFSERTFFLSALLSSALRCTGPPTPAVVKRVMLGPLVRIALPLSSRLVKALIRYDSLQDRDRDAYISFTLVRRASRASAQPRFVCPDCAADCSPPEACPRCGRAFAEIDGMLFMLPEEFRQIETEYSAELARTVPAEHL